MNSKFESFTLSRFSVILTSGIAIAGIIFLFPICFTWPAADDFSYAWIGKIESYLTLYINEYFVANGRYFSNLFVLLSIYITPCIWLYRFICIAALISVVLTNVLICKVLRFKSYLINAILISFVQFSICSSFAELFCWVPGIFVYTLAYILGSIALLNFYRIIEGQRKIALIVIAIIGGLASIGCNEIAMILLPLGSASLILFKKHKVYRSLLPYFIVALYIIAACIVYFAPGNQTRSEYFLDHLSIGDTIILTTVSYFKHVSLWFSSASVIVLFLYHLLTATSNDEQRAEKRNSAFFTLLILIIIIPIIAIIVPVYATGSLGQLRTLSLVSMVYVWLLVFLGQRLNYSIMLGRTKSIFVQRLTSLLIVMTVIFAGNGRIILEDIAKARFRKFNSQMCERDRTLLLQDATSNVVIDAIEDKPMIMSVPDLTCDTANWINKAAACYYNIKSVRVK